MQSADLEKSAADEIEKELAQIRKLSSEKAKLNIEIGENWNRIQSHSLRHPELSGTLKSLYEAAACW